MFQYLKKGLVERSGGRGKAIRETLLSNVVLKHGGGREISSYDPVIQGVGIFHTKYIEKVCLLTKVKLVSYSTFASNSEDATLQLGTGGKLPIPF